MCCLAISPFCTRLGGVPRLIDAPARGVVCATASRGYSSWRETRLTTETLATARMRSSPAAPVRRLPRTTSGRLAWRGGRSCNSHGSASAAAALLFSWTSQASPTERACAARHNPRSTLITGRSGGTQLSARPARLQAPKPNCARLTAGHAGYIPHLLRRAKVLVCRDFRCRRRDSNPRHADYDSAALWLYRAKNRGWGTEKGTCLRCGGQRRGAHARFAQCGVERSVELWQ